MPTTLDDVTKTLTKIRVEDDVDRDGEGDAQVSDEHETVQHRLVDREAVVNTVGVVDVDCVAHDVGDDCGDGYPQSHQGHLDLGSVTVSVRLCARQLETR